MRMYFRSASRRADLSAPIMVAAILMAAGLSKLGHGWWATTVMAALCGLVVVAEQLGWSTRRFGILRMLQLRSGQSRRRSAEGASSRLKPAHECGRPTCTMG